MKLANQIVAWQKTHGRHDLPWQNTTDAYRIWLSEVMLQQTQVVTVKAYYEKFLARFPSVFDLAKASQDEILALWAGLGYYSRARNLHDCAQTVVREWYGQFPQKPEQLQTLKGIGASTASAISVFAYGERAAILDGNVKRILCRYFGVDKPAGATADKHLWLIAQREIKALNQADDYRAYTQGLMDLGSSLCSRKKPNCQQCPLKDDCYAHQKQLTDQLPLAKIPITVQKMQVDFYVYSYQHKIWLERRVNKGIWAGLYCFPQEERLTRDADFSLPTRTHRLTHRVLSLNAQVFELSLIEKNQVENFGGAGLWISLEKINGVGMPKPIEQWVLSLLG